LIKRRLDKRLREELALTLTGANRCDYCASAHSATGKLAGLNEAEAEHTMQKLRGPEGEEVERAYIELKQ
jgi:AhpD family alkylhydroperoxidase